MTGRALSVGWAALVLGCGGSAPPPSEPIASSATPGEDASGQPPSSSGELPQNLTAEHIAPVIAGISPRMKAKCWQPALNARSVNDPKSVRVVMTIAVEPSGAVSSAETQGVPPSYATLPGCMATVLRSAKFPQATSVTHINIPYVFDAK